MNRPLFSTLIFLLLILNIQNVFGQNKIIDSLNVLLKNAKHDTTRISLYLKLCDVCEVKDNLKYSEPVIKLADKLLSETKDTLVRKNLLKKKAAAYDFELVYFRDMENPKSPRLLQVLKKMYAVNKEAGDLLGAVNAMVDMADYYFRNGDIMKQLEILQNGLEISKQNNNKRGQSRFIVQIGLLYSFQGDTANALDYLEKGLALEKEIGDSSRISRGYYVTGLCYYRMKRFNKAIEYYSKAVQRYILRKDLKALPQIYFQMGEAFLSKKDYQNAKINFKLAFDNAAISNDQKFWFLSMIALGTAETGMGNYKKAIEQHEKCYDLAKKENTDVGISLASTALAKDYRAEKDYKKAKYYSEQSVAIMKKQGAFIDRMNIEELAYKIDSAGGNYKDAYSHYTEFIRLHNQFLNEEVNKTASREKFQSELQKQKETARFEQDKKDALNVKEKQKQNIIIYSISAGLILVLLLAVFVFRSYRQKQKANIEISSQKHLIEEKHKEITDSINYAERIQRSFLASTELLDSNLKEHFVFFQPKDVVSGDFYWATKLSEGEGRFLLATADSTGHGVPGAIMSILNISCLENAVKEGMSEPSKILDHTRINIIERLKKDGSPEGGKDGMDCSLICFDPKNNKLVYAAANNPVWIVRASTSASTGSATNSATGAELIELAPDKMPVGKHDKDSVLFTQHEFELQKGDVVYTLTDGMPDQFGGAKGKKFMYKKLKELLISISNLPMKEQQQQLKKTLNDWKGNLEQVDDVCIIGVRV